jgi:L-fuculose-phosphate aldolase
MMNPASLQTQRAEIIAACLRLAEQGFLAGTGGNVALRLDDQHFAVTPSAADYYGLAPQDIAVVRLQDLEQVAGNLPPSVETGLHAAMLRAKPAVNASVHTHQPLASAVGLLNTSLPLFESADIAAMGSTVAIVGYAPSGTGMLVRALRRRLRPDLSAYLLRNHGLICAAPTLDAAVAWVGRIEYAAAAFLRQHVERLPYPESLRQAALNELVPATTP